MMERVESLRRRIDIILDMELGPNSIETMQNLVRAASIGASCR